MTLEIEETIMRIHNLLLGGFFVAFATTSFSMEFQVSGDQLLMSGAVMDGDYARVKDSFLANPNIKTAILRKSYGGDAWTGYRIGEYFREKDVTTVVSGWCVSSCSRMFLGGTRRVFSSDFSPNQTYVGFHGHYRNDGTLDSASVSRMGLKNWVLKFSGGTLPASLVDQWVSLHRSIQTVNFYPDVVAAKFGASIFECPRQVQTPGVCKVITGDAMSLGIITSKDTVASFDQTAILSAANERAKTFPVSGYAEVEDLAKVPLDASVGLDNYRRFLESPSPRAFAVSPTRRHWAWNSGGEEDTVSAALRRCNERAAQPCLLYAVDDAVVFKY